MNAPESGIEIPTAPGTPFAGGYYLGRYFIGATAYALIVSPKAEGEHKPAVWSGNYRRVAGALSLVDGHANTAAMAKSGSDLARWAMGLAIGGHSDWYLPSRVESLLLHAAEADASAFQKDGAEALERDWYWTSTQHASDPSYAWFQLFTNGYQLTSHEGFRLRARAVRRLAI